ncbi:MAG: hypothetical protein DRI44_04470 [Chlamydiae bacterium]|nr:MAG: hypothetical protein DRI44_04470 [Chlamydiota bacterium]
MKDIGIHKTIQIIARANNILILGHVNPDGDCIGSMTALSLGLKSIGKEVAVWSGEPLPLKYRFMKINFSEACQESLNDFDVIIVVDTAVETRIGAKLNLTDIKIPVLAIDHHIASENHFTYIHADQSQSATGCIIFDILKSLNVKITKSIAEAIYTAIITDTGCFSYSNTNYRTFEITLELLKSGINTSEITSIIYDSHSPEYIRILGASLKTLALISDGVAAIMYVSSEMIQKEGLKSFDTEDFVNYPRSIMSVKVACMITESPDSDILRVSFRSKTDDYDVSKLAKLFNGGGHKCAAGAKIKKPLAEFIPKLKKTIEDFLKKENNKS